MIKKLFNFFRQKKIKDLQKKPFVTKFLRSWKTLGVVWYLEIKVPAGPIKRRSQDEGFVCISELSVKLVKTCFQKKRNRSQFLSDFHQIWYTGRSTKK